MRQLLLLFSLLGGEVLFPIATAQVKMQAGKMLGDAQPTAAGSHYAIKDYGRAYLERVQNKTGFPLFVEYSKTKSEALPPGSVVQLKSVSQRYDAPRFFAIRSLGGKSSHFQDALFVRADSDDAHDPATHFIVNYFIDRDDKTWLLLSPQSDPTLFFKDYSLTA